MSPWATRLRQSATIDIGGSVISIGESAFQECYKLASIDLGIHLTSIGARAFEDCALTSIVIPDGVTSIADSTFEDCDQLDSIILGRNITSIGNRAFARWGRIDSVFFDGPPPLVSASAFESSSGVAYVWPEHADLFGPELSYWQGLLIRIRPNIPSNIVAGVTSLSLNGTTGTIQLSGGPNTVYQCHFSSDLTAFSEVETNPAVVRTNSNGTTSFTIETTDDKGFVILEIAP